MKLMPPNDAMFLLTESREQPMHVGGLQLFRLPEDAPPDYLRTLYRELLASTEVAPLFRKRPHRSVKTLGQWSWALDEAVDLEHHVRHSALPKPGRVRELLALVSRLHGTLLDRQRPLWEAHLIEGLREGRRRFAVYTKLHHAVMDGVSAMKLLQRTLSTDPEQRNTPVPWAPRESRSSQASAGGLLETAATAMRTATDLAGIGPTLARLAARALGEQAAVLPGQAPTSMLNVRITGSRRYAAQSWPLDQIKAIAKASGTTVNDVILAVSASALRRYLMEHDALPDAPLVAMTPVSLRGSDEGEESGNAVGAVLCSLATDVADPVDRLEAVHASMKLAKASLAGLSQIQATAVSALMLSPLLINTLVGVHRLTPPPFNIVISNVPGPSEALYWNGAELEGAYPLSIPIDGQALNITVASYNGNLDFGFTGCRRSVPQLQHLLTYTDEALTELEKGLGA